nr:hypothetical protein [Escherichia coli]
MTFMAPPQPLQVSMSILKNTLEPLRPCHRRSPLCWCCRFISHPDLVAPCPVFAGVTNARCRLLGANTPWKRVRLTLGFGTVGGQPCNEIQWFENDVRGAVPVRRLELVAHVAASC